MYLILYTVRLKCEPTLKHFGDSMFSKAELDYLKSPEKFDAAYGRVLRHRINVKSAQLREALLLLQGNEQGVTGNCNGVTEFSNTNQSMNYAYSVKRVTEIGAPAGIRTRVFGSKGRNT